MNDKNKISFLADKTKDAMQWSVKDMLQDSINDIDEGKYKNKTAILILLDKEEPGEYNTRYCQAGMRASEIVALLAYMQHFFLDKMLGTND